MCSLGVLLEEMIPICRNKQIPERPQGPYSIPDGGKGVSALLNMSLNLAAQV